ncbi:thioesterase II family protein [Sorangium atrum]|uniref:Thioesterase domain-containing protein n=1 Tax=Sorangium atrum TaxID=2995308 RepID=A0ABT5CDE2_9BACT|nr:thioesterase domain-containing protein [Sorangium aterium]MDC0684459.1 thioesterase domain-containing protein [Sorangium aterium]
MNRSTRSLRRILSASAQSSPHLILCPFGGASQTAFRSWKALSHVDVSASLVTYPGRDHRLHEPGMKSVQHSASELAHELCAEPPSGQWLLIGHSVGAQIAFEACRLLEQWGRAPAGLVLSACHAPHLIPRRMLSPLDDEGFVEELIRLGGCPAEFRTDPQLREVFMPMLRGDFLASESYRLALDRCTKRLRTPTLLLHGSADDEAREDEVDAWKHWLEGRVELRALAGDHFYITQDPRAFVSEVLRMFRLPSRSTAPLGQAQMPWSYFP